MRIQFALSATLAFSALLLAGPPHGLAAAVGTPVTAAIAGVPPAAGSLWAMGYNSNGQLGDGTWINRYTPELILSDGVQAVSAGWFHSLFVKTDGSLWAMGDNFDGQLGDGTTTSRGSPVQILSGGVQTVAAGVQFSMVLKADGSLWAMGRDQYGQLGDGTTIGPVQILSGGVQAIAAGGFNGLILKTDGSLWGTGYTTNRYTPEQILSGGVQAIAVGYGHCLIVKTDGSLWAMGGNTYGELGDGTTTQRNSPVQILSSGVQAVAAGNDFSLVLKTDGSLWAMGRNDDGELGDGTTVDRVSPVQILAGGVQAVAAGQDHSLVLKTDGSLWAMGYNWAGQLGVGAATYSVSTPELIAANVQKIAAGAGHSLFVASGDIAVHAPQITVQPVGVAANPGATVTFSVTATGTPAPTYQWYLNGQALVGATAPALTISNAQLVNVGNYYVEVSNGLASVPSDVVTLSGTDAAPTISVQPQGGFAAVGQPVTLRVTASGAGTLGYQWYFNGRALAGATGSTYTIASFAASQAGSYHVVVGGGLSATTSQSIQLVGPGSLWAMGYNANGQLGDGTTTNSLSPELILPGEVQMAAAGGDFSLILKTDGSLWAMGGNSYGQLGDRTTTQRDAPVQILSSGVQAIAAGFGHSLILKTDGSLWAMGLNKYGQLGNGTTNQRIDSPEQILAGGVQAIAAGYGHSLILKTDGSLWATGDNTYGQLGDGRTTQHNAPEEILSGGVQAIAAGQYHSLILKANGSLWVMGDNAHGELGDGTTTQRTAPVQIFPSGVQAVSAGSAFSLIVKTDGSLWAMGDNTYGELGDGTTTQRNAPVQILSSGVQAVAAGSDFGLILKADGSLWAMGDNVFGELGDGTTRQPNTPELITENVERISAGAMHSLFVSRGKIGLYAPQITVQPVNQTVRAGGGANFEVAASGNPAATYRWQVSTDGGFTWTSVTDTATYSITATGTLIITATTAGMNGYEYRCVASNSAGSATSNAATLTVISADQAFLQQLFLDVLGRPIDSGDLSAFGAALAGGESRSAVLGELLTSTEYANRQVEPVIRLYYAALARCPDYVGLQNWSDALQSGVLTLDDAGDQFASSAEFLHDYGNLNNTGYVQQLYRNVLGREADPAGVVHWGLCFLTGATWGHVLIGFSESPEFQADMANQVEIIRLYDLLLQRMPTAVELQTWQGFLLGYDQTDALFAQGYPAGLDDTDYVSLIFQGFLLRGVDAGTLSVFGSALTAGTVTHASLVNTLLNSAEFNQFVAPVSRLYMAAFHRVPDAGGLDNWVAYVRAGNSLQSAADAFVASPEFQLTYGSLNDTQYVTLLYENVLGREPDPIGLADWVAQLRAGTARGQVLIGFSESQEGIARCAPTVRTFLSYFVFIDAAPTQPDLDYWEHYLTTLDDQMRDDLLADPTFAN